MKKIITVLVVFIGFFVIIHIFDKINPSNDTNNCYYYLAMYKYQCKGVVTHIDTVVDRSGVGVYVDNYNVGENYNFYSDSLKQLAWVGDSVFKFKNSIYGYIKKYNGQIFYLSLLRKRDECDMLSDSLKEEIIRTSGVNFKD
ncbi:MAG: hypothetical protein U0Y96_09720 [Candidatus Kapaibacterium sp.]